MHSRRQFLALSTATAVGASLQLPLGIAREKAAQDPFGGWPIGVQSYSLRNFNLHQAVRHLQGLGVHHVEFYSKHLNPAADAKTIAETKQLVADAGVSINAHGVNRFTKDHDANRRVFEFAKAAGIKNITADPQPDSFDSLDKLVEEYDIRICIHNHGPGHRYDKIADVANAVKDHHKWIGACVDTGHFIRAGEDPVEAVTALGPRVFALHMKDDKFKGDKRSHNVILGEANLDVVAMFRALKDVKFPADGSISLEYESNPANPIDDMKQCLVVVKKAIATASEG